MRINTDKNSFSRNVMAISYSLLGVIFFVLNLFGHNFIKVSIFCFVLAILQKYFTDPPDVLWFTKIVFIIIIIALLIALFSLVLST